MQNTAAFWDKVAPKYAKSPIADMDAYTRTMDRTRRYLSASDTVLEVGCGTGSTSLLLAGHVHNITASDLSSSMVQIGSEKARAQGISNVKFVTAALSDLPIEDGPYDAILAFNVLHLVEDTPEAIRRINGLLKPGGIFISKTICRPQPGSAPPLKFRILKMALPLMQLVGMAPPVTFMKINELDDLISSEGFEIVETDNLPASPPSRFIVARKV